MAFCYTFTLSMYSFAYPFTVTQLNFGAELAAVPYAAFAFGIIFGGVLATPFEKRYGRKAVLLLTIPFFALILIGAGVSKSAAGLIVCRFLSAFFAGPGLFVIYGHASDMWTATRLSLPLAVFTGSILLGVSGGYVLFSPPAKILANTHSDQSLVVLFSSTKAGAGLSGSHYSLSLSSLSPPLDSPSLTRKPLSAVEDHGRRSNARKKNASRRRPSAKVSLSRVT